ncbi:PrsW family intramembrane metalloprotease [Leptolyngbya sp. AN02str]|uniref:PrsW family intramembrane metalloprotease n=1 Tax=Leptolyngbya sp. AN02str TaxID=3423363 RepID=UPI003D318FC9
MNILTLLVLAIAPGLFWLWYFYRRDKLEPEPRHLVIKIFVWGVLIAIPVVIVQLFFDWLPALMLFVVVAPVTEEYAKYWVVRHGVYNHAEFDEPMDGIVYAAAAALGFASIENVGYLLDAYFGEPAVIDGAATSTTEAVLTLFVLRSLLSVPGHALWASLSGYALGVSKFLPKAQSAGLIRKGLLLAMLSHGIFNGLLVISPWLALGLLIAVPLSWRMTSRRIRAAIASSPHAVSSDSSDSA